MKVKNINVKTFRGAILGILVLLILAACSQQEPQILEPSAPTTQVEAEAEPTDAPTPEPEPTAAVAEASAVPVTEAAPEEPTAEAPQASLPDDLTAQLDAFLQSQVYADGGDPKLAAPGLVLYVQTPDGRYLNAAGAANLDDGTPMQGDDILEIGSNTKSMTVVLLMQLVEEGLVSLDDPLSDYLPDQAAILPNGDQITIRQLAHHTSGIWDYGDEIIGAGAADPAALVADYTPTEIVQYALDKGEPDFAPGEEDKWKYSNTGYILLGMVIEAVSGETYADLLQARIFDPLGLESAVLIESVPQEGEITTRAYYWKEDGEIIDATDWNGSQGWAAGSVAMTAQDLATYGQALAAGEFFQNPDTLAEMLTFDTAAVSIVGGPYGLGLMDLAGDGTVWGHEGATFGFQSLWYTKPESDIIVVGLTNGGNYSAFAFLNVLNILEGNGAQPFSPITLLPIGQFIGTNWRWEQFLTPVETTAIDEEAGLAILLNKDGRMTAITVDCGLGEGSYTSAGMGSISFDFDVSSLTCDSESLAGQFVQHLNDAVSWHFTNGRLAVDLPADGGTLLFVPSS